MLGEETSFEFKIALPRLYDPRDDDDDDDDIILLVHRLHASHDGKSVRSTVDCVVSLDSVL